MKRIVVVLLSDNFSFLFENLFAAKSETKTKPSDGIINDLLRDEFRPLPHGVSAGNSACLQRRKIQDHSLSTFEVIYAY